MLKLYKCKYIICVISFIKKCFSFLEKDIDFPEMHTIVNCPKTMSFQGYAIRGIWTNYDHLSDTAPSFILPNKPDPIKGFS